jgi:stage V sporulation protein G
MEITEVRIKLVENGNERLRAFCSITLDGDFVIRDLKVIDGTNGPFVAMPSRKLMDRCPRCSAKNHLRARFCNECGAKFNENRAPKDAQGRAKLHADVAHPINAACRERVQKAVVEAYLAEVERSKSPDYKPASLDEYDDFEEDLHYSEHHEPAPRRPADAPPPNRAAESREQAGGEKDDDSFGDYNALIQDLKREAQQRRGDRGADRFAPPVPEVPVFQPEPPAPREQARRPEPKPVAPLPHPAPAAPRPQEVDEFGTGL